MFRIKRIDRFILFIMKKYKLITAEGEYLVTIEKENGKIVTTKDAQGNYRNILKDKLIEV